MKEAKLDSSAKAAFGVAVVLTVLASAIDSGALGWIVAPFVLLLLWYAMAKVPLRISLFVLMFCGLTLENPSEQPAVGLWKSPLWGFASLMMMHLKNTIGGGIPFSGMDLMLVSLGVVAIRRKSTASRLDGYYPAPKPLLQLAYVSLAATAFLWIGGMIRGGDNSFAMWQIDRVIYVPVVFLLFQAGLRGPADYEALARVFLASATIRACQAMYVRSILVVPPDPTTGESGLPYATSHNDSMLFAFATILIAVLVYQRIKGSTRLAVLLSPILIGGMLANTRRMVWVQIGSAFLFLYLLTDSNEFKRKLQRTLKLTSPLALVYIAAGWSSNSKIFKPVKTIRSAIDSKADLSTQWRDLENFNLIYTIHQNPIFGTGYGHGFTEAVALPQVDYSLERYIPHNSILGLWTYGGYVGYTALTALWVAGVYFAMRSYRASAVPLHRAAALATVGGVLVYYVQCYGDMGLGSWTGVYIIAPCLAVAAKLAVPSGAWPGGAPQRTAIGASRNAPA
jgi:hypothetical protein